MSERYERLVEAINVTAVGCMRQAPKLNMKLNSQDPRINNARDAITTVHKALYKTTYQSNHTLYKQKRIEVFQIYKVIYDEEVEKNFFVILGSMAQWDNRKLVSQRSRVRLQAVLVFILCLSRT